MAKASLVVGSTSIIREILIQDSTSTTGGGKTGLTNASSGLTCYYKRDSGSASVAVTLDASTGVTLGTYEPTNAANGALKEVDATNAPGLYEFHVPNNALASGAKAVVFVLRGVTGMVDCRLEIELTAINNQDVVRGGMTALPNASANAAGGVNDVQYIKGQAVICSAGVTVGDHVGTTGASTAQTGDAYAKILALLTANGNLKASLQEMLTTALTETAAGDLSAGLKTLLEYLKVNSTVPLPSVMPETSNTAANLRTPAVWYVATNGNDSNSGTFALPKLTIGAAVAVASSNDTIIIGAGTFSETVTTGNKILNFIGAGAALTIVASPSGYAFFQMPGGSLTSLTAQASGANGAVWVYGSAGTTTNQNAANITIQDCQLLGDGSGPISVDSDHCESVVIRRCFLKGNVALDYIGHALLEDCVFDISSGNYIIEAYGSQIEVNRCFLRISNGGFGNKSATGVSSQYLSQLIIRDSDFNITGTTTTGVLMSGNALIERTTFTRTGTGYDINQTSGTTYCYGVSPSLTSTGSGSVVISNLPLANTVQVGAANQTAGDLFGLLTNSTYGLSQIQSTMAKDATVSKPATAQTIAWGANAPAGWINAAAFATGVLPTRFGSLAIDTVGDVTFNNTSIGSVTNNVKATAPDGTPLATHADITNLESVTPTCGIGVSQYGWQIPATGSTAYPFAFTIKNPETGALIAPDSGSLAIHAFSQTDTTTPTLDANLSTPTTIAAGDYLCTYSVANNATQQEIRIEVSGTINSGAIAFKGRAFVYVANIIAESFTAADRSNMGTPMQAATPVQLAASQPNYAPAKKTDILGGDGSPISMVGGKAAATVASGDSADEAFLSLLGQQGLTFGLSVLGPSPAHTEIALPVSPLLTIGGASSILFQGPNTTITQYTDAPYTWTLYDSGHTWTLSNTNSLGSPVGIYQGTNGEGAVTITAAASPTDPILTQVGTALNIARTDGGTIAGDLSDVFQQQWSNASAVQFGAPYGLIVSGNPPVPGGSYAPMGTDSSGLVVFGDYPLEDSIGYNSISYNSMATQWQLTSGSHMWQLSGTSPKGIYLGSNGEPPAAVIATSAPANLTAVNGVPTQLDDPGASVVVIGDSIGDTNTITPNINYPAAIDMQSVTGSNAGFAIQYIQSGQSLNGVPIYVPKGFRWQANHMSGFSAVTMSGVVWVCGTMSVSNGTPAFNLVIYYGGSTILGTYSGMLVRGQPLVMNCVQHLQSSNAVQIGGVSQTGSDIGAAVPTLAKQRPIKLS